jgi:hypothetical protein
MMVLSLLYHGQEWGAMFFIFTFGLSKAKMIAEKEKQR